MASFSPEDDNNILRTALGTWGIFLSILASPLFKPHNYPDQQMPTLLPSFTCKETTLPIQPPSLVHPSSIQITIVRPPCQRSLRHDQGSVSSGGGLPPPKTQGWAPLPGEGLGPESAQPMGAGHRLGPQTVSSFSQALYHCSPRPALLHVGHLPWTMAHIQGRLLSEPVSPLLGSAPNHVLLFATGTLFLPVCKSPFSLF